MTEHSKRAGTPTWKIALLVLASLAGLCCLSAVVAATVQVVRQQPEHRPASVVADPVDLPDPAATAALTRNMTDDHPYWSSVFVSVAVFRRGETMRGIVQTNIQTRGRSDAAIQACVRAMLYLPGDIRLRKVRVLAVDGTVLAHNGPGHCVSGGWFAP